MNAIDDTLRMALSELYQRKTEIDEAIEAIEKLLDRTPSRPKSVLEISVAENRARFDSDETRGLQPVKVIARQILLEHPGGLSSEELLETIQERGGQAKNVNSMSVTLSRAPGFRRKRGGKSGRKNWIFMKD